MILRTFIILFIAAACFGCASEGDFSATYSTDVKIKSIDGDDVVIEFKVGRIDVLEEIEIPRSKASQLKEGNYIHSTIELLNHSFNGSKYKIFFLGESIENMNITSETLSAELPFIKDVEITWFHSEDIKKHERTENVVEKEKPEVKDSPKTNIPASGKKEML